MSRKLTALAVGAVLWAFSVSAETSQAKKVPRIGFLSVAPLIDPAFLETLRSLGYVEGKNITVELRSAQGKLDRLPDLAAELVSLNVDIIVTQGTLAAQASKKATTTIPIVMATGGDPVGVGLVASLARPGGNITGLSLLNDAVVPKQLELLEEVLPKISRVAWMANPAIATEMMRFKELQSIGPSLGVTIELTEVHVPEDFESAFAVAVRDRVHAAMVPPNSSYIPHRQQIVALGAKHRLAVAYGFRDFPEAGGLMSYGVSVTELFCRAAVYVDKILKGVKPADLPVEQPKKFEFVINLKAAKEIGFTIPPNVLARADRVIK